eukprot:gene20658-27444_t
MVEWAEVQFMLECAEVQFMLQYAEVQFTLECADVQFMLECPEVQFMLECAEVQFMLECPEVQFTFECAEVQFTLECAEVQFMLQYAEVQFTLECAEVQFTLECNEVQFMLECPEVQFTFECAEVQFTLDALKYNARLSVLKYSSRSSALKYSSCLSALEDSSCLSALKYSSRLSVLKYSARLIAPKVQFTPECTEVQFTVVETTRQDHARDIVTAMDEAQMANYQGIIAIGGDGLFQEILTGLMKHRLKWGSAVNSPSHTIRLGHIPGGSTDACAYSLHGTRSVEVAVMHILLGDRLSLDVSSVCAPGDPDVKYFVCQAAYGFLGDVLRMSEGMRAVGPSRYDLAGALKFLQLNSYEVNIAYQLAEPSEALHQPHGKISVGYGASGPVTITLQISVGQVQISGASGASVTFTIDLSICQSSTSIPSQATGGPSYAHVEAGTPTSTATLSPSSSAQTGERGGTLLESTGGVQSESISATVPSTSEPSSSLHCERPAVSDPPRRLGLAPAGRPGQWVSVKGTYMSIMAVVMPCRSHMSKNGIVPDAHISDGRMHLVLLGQCSHINHFPFLLTTTLQSTTRR